MFQTMLKSCLNHVWTSPKPFKLVVQAWRKRQWISKVWHLHVIFLLHSSSATIIVAERLWHLTTSDNGATRLRKNTKPHGLRFFQIRLENDVFTICSPDSAGFPRKFHQKKGPNTYHPFTCSWKMSLKKPSMNHPTSTNGKIRTSICIYDLHQQCSKMFQDSKGKSMGP